MYVIYMSLPVDGVPRLGRGSLKKDNWRDLYLFSDMRDMSWPKPFCHGSLDTVVSLAQVFVIVILGEGQTYQAREVTIVNVRNQV